MPTDRERQVYAFIRRYIARHGFAPKLTEIADGIGIRSRGVIHRYLQALADAGLIEIEAGRHRGIRLADPATAESGLELPLLGSIVAGMPLQAVADEQTIDLAEFFVSPDRFVLRVQGDSMIDAGILDGDMVVVRQTARADNGDIVVALIDGDEATLKTLRHNPDGSVTLIPANPALAPMVYPAGRIQVQGVVVAQLRAYR